jgi:hypothetical protein
LGFVSSCGFFFGPHFCIDGDYRARQQGNMSGGSPFTKAVLTDRSGSKELLRAWETQLDSMRFGLNRNMATGNLTTSDQRDALLSVFCDELVLAQQKFLQQAEAMGFISSAAPSRGEIVTRNGFAVGELLAAILAGLATAWFATGWIVAVATTTTGMWWWKTTTVTGITMVAALSTKLGVPASLVIVGIFVVAAYLTWRVVRGLTIGMQRTLIRRHILSNFDNSIRPRLQEWARAIVGGR